MRIRTVLLGMGLLAALAARSAQAAPLGLTLIDKPDIVSAFIDVTYDATSDTLTASGFALAIDVPPPTPIVGGTFDLLATIDDTGALISGSLTVGGAVLGGGPMLLTGVLNSFGFPSGPGDPFEFLFNVTGGDLAGLFGGIGSLNGVILSGTGFPGDFTGDFDNLIAGIPGTGTGMADIAPVPEPATITLFLLGAITLLAGGHWRRRKQLAA